MALDFSKIRAFAFDVDGVLTDGTVYAFDNDLFRCYDAKDGLAMRMAATKGYKLVVITGGRSDTIRQRFVSCGVAPEDIHLHTIDKLTALEEVCQKYGFDRSEVVYCGDDLPDIPAMNYAGIGACPCDAVEEVKAVADYVGEFPGGHGFVRRLIENVMKARGDWSLDLGAYTQSF